MVDEVRDITIIGGGPSGLFGAFYAGMRGASVRLLDALPELGGQLTALYPEKPIFDVAGFPRVLAKDLVKDLVRQAMQFKPEVHVAQEVTAMRTEEEGGRPVFVLTTPTGTHRSRTLLVTAGIGAFQPRRLPLADHDHSRSLSLDPHPSSRPSGHRVPHLPTGEDPNGFPRRRDGS